MGGFSIKVSVFFTAFPCRVLYGALVGIGGIRDASSGVPCGVEFVCGFPNNGRGCPYSYFSYNMILTG